MRYAALALMLLLGGCGTTTPQIVTKTVNVEVPVKCKPDIKPDPNYPDSDAALKKAPNIFVWTQLVIAGRLMRIERELELKTALKACEG